VRPFLFAGGGPAFDYYGFMLGDLGQRLDAASP
jgi:hypothetical protein